MPAAEQAPAPALPDFLPGELALASAALPAEEPAQPAAEADYPFTTTDPFVGAAIPSEGHPDPSAEVASAPPAAEAEAAALPTAEPLPLEATALPTAQGLPDDVSAVLGSGGTAAGSSAAGGGGSQPLPEVLQAASPPPPVSSDLLPDPSKRTGEALHEPSSCRSCVEMNSIPGPLEICIASPHSDRLSHNCLAQQVPAQQTLPAAPLLGCRPAAQPPEPTAGRVRGPTADPTAAGYGAKAAPAAPRQGYCRRAQASGQQGKEARGTMYWSASSSTSLLCWQPLHGGAQSCRPLACTRPWQHRPALTCTEQRSFWPLTAGTSACWVAAPWHAASHT